MMRLSITLGLCLALVACNNSTETKKTNGQTNITTGGVKDETGATLVSVGAKSITKKVKKDEFIMLMDKKDGVLLDVRTPAEFNEGNIEGSINHDILDNKFMASVKQLDRTTPIFVYCKSGGRSSRATSDLKKAGFKEVYDLIGGYDGWNE